MKERNKRKSPYTCERKPSRVNMYHPIIMNKNPLKKKMEPLILEDLMKKPSVLLGPMKEIMPMIKEIYG